MKLFEFNGTYLNAIFGEIRPEEVILICGYPGIGKTSFGLFLQQEWMLLPGKGSMTWICSAETEESMKECMFCAARKIHYLRYQCGHISYQEKRCLERTKRTFFQRHKVCIRRITEPYPAMNEILKELPCDTDIVIIDDLQDQVSKTIGLQDIMQDLKITAVRKGVTTIALMNIDPYTPEAVLKPVETGLFSEYEKFCTRIFSLYEPYTDHSNDEGFDHNHLILKPLKNDYGSYNSVRLAYRKGLFEEIESEKLNMDPYREKIISYQFF